jgi:subtilisin family serine protease
MTWNTLKGKSIGIILALTLVFSSGLSRKYQELSFQPVIEPSLEGALSGLASTQQVSVIVYLKDQVDLNRIVAQDRNQRLRLILLALQDLSLQSQTKLRSYLQDQARQGKVRVFTPLWIINAIAVSAQADVIHELAEFPEVKEILPDKTFEIPPTRSGEALSPFAVPAPNLTLINVPAMWALGFKGQGVVIASMDTGVDYEHPDLETQWRGGENSWYDPYGQHPNAPADLNGHGTQTMGVMVARNDSGVDLGVAPQASWIAVKIFKDDNTAQTSAIHLGYQWLLDPDGDPDTDDAPDIVNNSWDFASPGCDLSFEPDLQALLAVNILPVFAAGNYGPNQASSASPANNPGAFAVGSIDNQEAIDPISSLGPNTCGQVISDTYPALVAPGVQITTTDRFETYTTSSGTSLAAPHVSAALALLLSALPGLSISEQRAALLTTTHDLGLPGADNTYGAGRIDVLAAYQALSSGLIPTPTFTHTPTATFTPTRTPTPTPTATPTPTPTQVRVYKYHFALIIHTHK